MSPTYSMAVKDRFWAYVHKTDDCWLWVGYTDPKTGYGRLTVARRNTYAHRLVYELVKGEIPPSLTLDHLCRQRNCVNPDHLEPVSKGENVLRGESFSAKYARQTSCKEGHPFEGENLLINSQGRRVCRECRRAYMRSYKAAHKAGAD